MGDTLRQMEALFGGSEPGEKEASVVTEMNTLVGGGQDATVADDEPSVLAQMNALMPEEVTPEVIESSDSPILDRIVSGAKSFVQGIGQPISSIPKSAELALNNADPAILEDFDRIDRTGKFMPKFSMGAAGVGDPVEIPQPQLEAYRDASPEERQQMRAEFSQRQADAILTGDLYQAGNDLDDWFKENFPTNEQFQGEFWADKVPNALGQVIPIAAEVAATRKIPVSGAKYLSYGVGAAQGGAMNAPGQFEDALNNGADIGTALDAAYIGGAVGLTEVAPIGALFNRLDKASGGVVKKKLAAIVSQGSQEAVQEAFVEVMNNATAQQLYDPERGLWTDQTTEAAGVGFTTGAILEVMTGLLPGRQRGPGALPTQADLEAADAEAQAPPIDPVEELDDIEQQAREEVADEGGDLLEQTLAGQEAVNAAEGDLLDGTADSQAQAALDEQSATEAAEADQAEQDAFDASPEGRVSVLEEELIAENNEKMARREAAGRAVQRLTDAGVPIEPGTGIESEIQRQAEEEAAAAESEVGPIEETPTAMNLSQRREAAQRAVQERIETDQRLPGDEQADADTRAQSQEKAAQDYARGVQRVEQETLVEENVEGVPDVMAAEQRLAEQVARVEPGEVINPVMRQAFEQAAQSAQTSVENDLPQPTQEQIDAGNYKKGHVNLQGLDISIENPKGSVRSSRPDAPKQWSQEMAHHYGYIRRTEGADGDQVDVFVGEDIDAGNVFVIDQIDQDTGNFDEHKVMLGFKNPAAAKRGYLQSYESGWKAGPITQMPVSEFKAWLRNSDTTQPANASTPVGTITEADSQTPQRGIRARQETTPVEPGNVAVQEEVNKIQNRLPNIKAQVVDSVDSLPSNLASEVRNRPGARALYDVENDQVYVIADQHSSPEDVERTMLHEGVAHKGLRYVMNSGELNNMLDGVYASADTAALEEIASQYNLDLTNTAQQQEAAEEYIARLAEAGDNSNIFKRAVAAVRKALRAVGLAKTWTDNDIRGLLREAHKEMAGTPAQRTMIELEAEVAETGESVTIQQPADVAIRQLDKRMNVIEKLRGCIG